MAGSAEDKVQIGKELYYTSIGEFDPPAPGQPAITGRMSNLGWGSCSACHPFGLTDNVVWIFGAGPRRTVPQHVDFTGGNAATLRALNWSAIFDEEEDFEQPVAPPKLSTPPPAAPTSIPIDAPTLRTPPPAPAPSPPSPPPPAATDGNSPPTDSP